MPVYIFIREREGEEFFYPVELVDDKEAIGNAECNPGTIQVETLSGQIVWKKENSNGVS